MPPRLAVRRESEMAQVVSASPESELPNMAARRVDVETTMQQNQI